MLSAAAPGARDRSCVQRGWFDRDGARGHRSHGLMSCRRMPTVRPVHA